MADMLPETKARTLGALLDEHKGQDVAVLDIRQMCGWTEFFIIATVTSAAHMDGLERHIKEYCRGNDIDILGKSRRNNTGDDEWSLIDLGSIVIHLMSKACREFYELERLWAKIT
jgi:ribosome-associated protein